MANLTLMGMYNYDSSIIEALNSDNLPDTIDAETLKNKIIIDTAELEIYIPRPDVFKYVFSNWVTTRKEIWAKLAATMHYDYNPLYNKDAYFSETRAREITETEGITGEGSTETEGTTTQTRDATSTTQKSAYNGTSYADYDKDIIDDDGTQEETGSTSFQNEQNRERGQTESETYTRREYGNIGITSSQQLIEEERKISGFNLYDYITEEFKSRFCVLIY